MQVTMDDADTFVRFSIDAYRPAAMQVGPANGYVAGLTNKHNARVASVNARRFEVGEAATDNFDLAAMFDG